MSCGLSVQVPMWPKLHSARSWEPGELPGLGAWTVLKTRLRPWSWINTSFPPPQVEGKVKHTFVGWQNQMHVSSVPYLCPRTQEEQKYWLRTLLTSQCNWPINTIQCKELHSRWAKLQTNCLISFLLQWKDYLVTGMTRFPFNNNYLLLTKTRIRICISILQWDASDLKYELHFQRLSLPDHLKKKKKRNKTHHPLGST